MFNQSLISIPAPPLSPADSVESAIQLFEDLRVSYWPVTEDGVFKGLLSEETLMDAGEHATINDLSTELLPFSVFADEYFLSAARLVTERRLDLVPVITTDGEYQGVIMQSDLLQKLAVASGAHTPGGIIVLEVAPIDYSPGEINRLIETNNAQITQLNTSFDEPSGMFHVVLRLNKEEISDVIATFQRYDYHIVYYAGEEQYENELKRNYHHLVHFLEM